MWAKAVNHLKSVFYFVGDSILRSREALDAFLENIVLLMLWTVNVLSVSTLILLNKNFHLFGNLENQRFFIRCVRIFMRIKRKEKVIWKFMKVKGPFWFCIEIFEIVSKLAVAIPFILIVGSGSHKKLKKLRKRPLCKFIRFKMLIQGLNLIRSMKLKSTFRPNFYDAL